LWSEARREYTNSRLDFIVRLIFDRQTVGAELFFDTADSALGLGDAVEDARWGQHTQLGLLAQINRQRAPMRREQVELRVDGFLVE